MDWLAQLRLNNDREWFGEHDAVVRFMYSVLITLLTMQWAVPLLLEAMARLHRRRD